MKSSQEFVPVYSDIKTYSRWAYTQGSMSFNVAAIQSTILQTKTSASFVHLISTAHHVCSFFYCQLTLNEFTRNSFLFNCVISWASLRWLPEQLTTCECVCTNYQSESCRWALNFQNKAHPLFHLTRTITWSHIFIHCLKHNAHFQSA